MCYIAILFQCCVVARDAIDVVSVVTRGRVSLSVCQDARARARPLRQTSGGRTDGGDLADVVRRSLSRLRTPPHGPQGFGRTRSGLCVRARLRWGQVNGFLISFYGLTYFMVCRFACACIYGCPCVLFKGIAFVCGLPKQQQRERETKKTHNMCLVRKMALKSGIYEAGSKIARSLC